MNREEIRAGVIEIIRRNRPTILRERRRYFAEDTTDEILKYLDENGVRIKVLKPITFGGKEMGWPRYERLIEE